MLPGFHAVEHLELLLGRQAGEVLEALAKDLLALGRQAAERRIILQCVFLFRRRKVFVLTQPISSVSLLRSRLCRTGNVLLRRWHTLLWCGYARLRGGDTWLRCRRLTMLLPGSIQSQTRMGEGCEYG